MKQKSKKVDPELKRKLNELKVWLRSYSKVLVAFSGGKDSFFLLKTAVEVLGKRNTLACFIKSNFTSKNDRKRIEYFTHQKDFLLQEIQMDVVQDLKIKFNSRERCYFCKKKIFNKLIEVAGHLGFKFVLDGTTYSDLSEHRPGMKALEELKVISPLKDFQITSSEIQTYLKENLGIDDYYLTSSTCLATRFPYDMVLETSLIRQFDDIESFFVDMGIYPIKIRYIPEGIRIETLLKNFPMVHENREEIIKFCQQKKMKFVTLDLEGIKTGVWD